MTAYVVWGFAVAREAGSTSTGGRRSRARRGSTDGSSRRRATRSEQAWMLHALAAWRAATPPRRPSRSDGVRQRLGASREAHRLLARAARARRARLRRRRARRGAGPQSRGRREDRRAPDVRAPHGRARAPRRWPPRTGARSSFWWRWYEGPVETTAFALQALVDDRSEEQLVEPAMNWLVKNRRGAQWNNTRDTAIAILALDDYLAAQRRAGRRRDVRAVGERARSSPRRRSRRRGPRRAEPLHDRRRDP